MINSLPWWIEIETNIPSCIYYFGPFDSFPEAQLYQQGYIEDFIEEKAQGITVTLKKCQPIMFTICKE